MLELKKMSLFLILVMFLPTALVINPKVNFHHKKVTLKKPAFDLFDLFSFAKFSGSKCTTDSGLNGTCFPTYECVRLGGVSQGVCGSGLGVCCVFEKKCGESSSFNQTFFTASGLPSLTSCEFTICPSSNEVCKLRIDFEQFELSGPFEDTAVNVVDTAVKNLHSIVGDCNEDSITIKSAEGPAPPVICGMNTGEHMYISLKDGCSKIYINTGEVEFQRKIRFKATQILCRDEPYNNCLQYFTGQLRIKIEI